MTHDINQDIVYEGRLLRVYGGDPSTWGIKAARPSTRARYLERCHADFNGRERRIRRHELRVAQDVSRLARQGSTDVKDLPKVFIAYCKRVANESN